MRSRRSLLRSCKPCRPRTGLCPSKSFGKSHQSRACIHCRQSRRRKRTSLLHILHVPNSRAEHSSPKPIGLVVPQRKRQEKRYEALSSCVSHQAKMGGLVLGRIPTMYNARLRILFPSFTGELVGRRTPTSALCLTPTHVHARVLHAPFCRRHHLNHHQATRCHWLRAWLRAHHYYGRHIPVGWLHSDQWPPAIRAIRPPCRAWRR